MTVEDWVLQAAEDIAAAWSRHVPRELAVEAANNTVGFLAFLKPHELVYIGDVHSTARNVLSIRRRYHGWEINDERAEVMINEAIIAVAKHTNLAEGSQDDHAPSSEEPER